MLNGIRWATRRLRASSAAGLLHLFWWFTAAISFAQTPVLLISIDGMRPDYVLEADKHGLRLPNLRRFMAEGSYAAAVKGVTPTVTYPSHTTLVTGVSPAVHGIYANTTFDPLNKNYGGWYWYAEDVKVPTLWDEARKGGLVTANVHWPVTLGANIDFNLPQIWRAATADDRKLVRALSTPGLFDLVERGTSLYAGGADETIAGDRRRAQAAVRIVRLKRPGFMTVYLTALDHVEHETGPFSRESKETLEQIDGLIGQLREAAGRQSVVCVVSDHGFAATEKDVNLNSALREAGLIELNANGKVQSWLASAWLSGGSAAVMLAPGSSGTVRGRVSGLLQKLAGDPANGIDRVITGEQLRATGGYPDAAFLVGCKPGFKMGEHLDGPLITPTATRGMHGYLPDLSEMNSTFLVAGPGIPATHSLGVIDMRDIAPTLAAMLGVDLTRAQGRNLFSKGAH